ncbi:MAG: hypothetical protein ACI82Z_001895 [Cellvibrionaceae bacterium]
MIAVLELSRPEEYIRSTRGYPGRPKKDRTPIARAFVAKAVYNVPNHTEKCPGSYKRSKNATLVIHEEIIAQP